MCRNVKLNCLLLTLIFINNSVYSDEIFNYYKRNIDGSFVIANIEEDRGMRYFEYALVDEDNENKIIGYYYNTNIIKFIDIIKNARIILSKYFDNNGNLVYQKGYFYDDDKKLISLIIDCQNEYFIFHSEVKIDYTGSLVKMRANRCIETAILIENDILTMNFISFQLFDDNFLPLYNETVSVTRNRKTTRTTKINEKFEYTDRKIKLREILENNIKIFTEEHKYDEIICIEEKWFNKESQTYAKTICKSNNLVEERVWVYPDFESVSEYQINEIADGLSLKYEGLSISLISEDERVSMTKVDSEFFLENRYIRLLIKIDPFFDFPFVNNYLYKTMGHPVMAIN